MALLFWLLALLSSAYGSIFGGRDGRWAAVLILLASLLTILAAHLDGHWAKVEVARLLVDCALLVALYALALGSRRYWPIWMTGFHLIAVLTHLSVLLVPSYVPAIYRAFQSFWAIPVLLSFLIGVMLDRRAQAAFDP